jgi:transcriptional regulator with GAF, ATPase, and Fis domain/CHASE2 domain-containing sensor protein
VAGQTVTGRDAIVISGIALLLLAAVLLFRGPLDSLEEPVTALHYTIRGTRQADTNVVVVYIDQEGIKTLGWPVRRSFYALMIKALTDLRVQAVCIEPVFEDRKLEYPEYDDLMARMIAAAGNVVLTGYFDTVAQRGSPRPVDSLAPPLGVFPGVSAETPSGDGIHLPLPALRAGAAGVGHVNIAGDADVELFIRYGDAQLPAFGAEIIRVFTRTGREGVVSDGARTTFRRDGASLAFGGGEHGRVEVNFPGSLGAFTAYPFLEVLRSYDALRSDRPGEIPVASFRGKIVLLGVIAEGRGEFVRTPIDARYPAILLHAAFVDNALDNGFLVRTPFWATMLLCLAIAGLASWAGIALSSPARALVVVGVPVAVLLLSFILFAKGGILLPVIAPLFGALVAGVAASAYRHRQARVQVDTLETEKQAILERLRDREAKVAVLEQELVTMEQARSRDRTGELLGELKTYKAEIRALASQADDLDAYEGATAEASLPGEFEGIVYAKNGPMKSVVEFTGKVAASDAPVLILGESGTGKELVARALHRRSPRAHGAFVAVNCGALSESLLESELFGHEKGAFTGAIKERLGRFELAGGGTIFLDEIGEVSPGFQLKLLRVLQEGEFERVGGTATLRANVRVVAATNKDLRELVRQKGFREDLYYRLNVLSIALPPLRERQTDIPLLVEHFLKREGGEIKVSRNVMDALQAFGWPGNIRELESALKRGVLMARAEGRLMMTIRDLSEEVSAAARNASPVEEQVLEALREKGFSRSSVSDTADELGGLNRGTVAEYLRGECLRTFVESGFDIEKAVRRLSLSGDESVNNRVRKKFEDYLASIGEAIDPSRPWDENRSSLRPKSKNLPQKYHRFLDQVAEACFRGLWKSPDATRSEGGPKKG